MVRHILTFSTLFFLLLPGLLQAQLLPGSEPSGTTHTFFPLAGYTSDYGLFGGIIYQRRNYGESQRPYLSNTTLDMNGSTKGKLGLMADHERIKLMGRPIRNRTTLYLERNPVASFYGIGNEAGFSRSEFNDGIFFLLQQSAMLRFEARRAIYHFGEESRLEGVLRLKATYMGNDGRGEDTRFVIDPPPGSEGGWSNFVGTGLVFDSRNSEFDPRRGMRAEAGVDFSTAVLGSDYNFSNYFADVRGYLSITEQTVFAQRLSAKYSHGDAPFWELPTLGNKYGLRGFAINRFIGDSSLLYMAEVRRWLFSFFEDEIRIGGHLFYDTGRVFSDFDNPALFDGWKNTWGFGGTLSAFSPDMVLRGEIGFSGEDYRIYAGVGFAF